MVAFTDLPFLQFQPELFPFNTELDEIHTRAQPDRCSNMHIVALLLPLRIECPSKGIDHDQLIHVSLNRNNETAIFALELSIKGGVSGTFAKSPSTETTATLTI